MKYCNLFQVKPGTKVELSKIDPAFVNDDNKSSSEKKTKQSAKRLRELQYHIYAEAQHSVLICLQGMDSAGKDGTIIHVLGAMDPLGTRVYDFKVPSKEEESHDFLWRIEKQVPAKGEVVIFNRSHYEDVLAPRVHKTISRAVWSKRYDFINDFETMLSANGTRILKFFFHISPEEQLKRFKDRLDDPLRQWKISESDYTERELWPAYISAYEDALSKTSTDCAPWYIIPANHKWFRDLAVSNILVEELESLGLKLPKPTVDINEIRREYHEAQSDGLTDKK